MRKQQQGVVLVVALFIVALVATLSYIMIARVDRDMRRTSLILHAAQADYYAQGSLFWAVDQLRRNWELKKPNRTVDAMPMMSPALIEDGYRVKSVIYDMQARFNLNNLRDKSAQASFVRLLMATVPTLREAEAQRIAQATKEWVSSINQESEFDRQYLRLSRPYRAAHRRMSSPTELRLVRGMTPEIFKAVQPYVAALPRSTLINVQTAEVPVLMTLNPGFTQEAAKSILNSRVQAPLVTEQAFANLDVVKNRNIHKTKITVVSNYFLVETTVSIEKQQVVIYTLLRRIPKERKAAIKLLWSGIGAW